MGAFDLLLHFDPNVGRNASGKERENLKSVCQEFEALFWEQLLKNMRKTIPKTRFWGQGREEELYTALYDQELSVVLSRRGGLNLAETLFGRLESFLGDRAASAEPERNGDAPDVGEPPSVTPVFSGNPVQNKIKF